VLAIYLMILSTLRGDAPATPDASRSFVTVTGKGFRTQPIRLRWSRFVLLAVGIFIPALTVLFRCW